jgi:hypothetical protein
MLVPSAGQLKERVQAAWEALEPFWGSEVLILGGLPRSVAASQLGIKRLPWGRSTKQDVDAVVFDHWPDAVWERLAASLGATRTLFGGLRYTVGDLSVDVFRFLPGEDVHYPQFGDASALTYVSKVPPFSSDQFALTRNGVLLMAEDALRNLRELHLTLRPNVQPKMESWAARRILAALVSGWTICPTASKWYSTYLQRKPK